MIPLHHSERQGRNGEAASEFSPVEEPSQHTAARAHAHAHAVAVAVAVAVPLDADAGHLGLRILGSS